MKVPVLRPLLPLLALLARSAGAEPMGPCEGGVCDIDHGERPWVLTDDCRENLDVVGYQQCRRFGEWGRVAREPDMAVEVGLGMHHVLAPPVPPMMATARGAALARYADLGTGDVRISAGAHGLYGGVELAVGDLTRDTYPLGAFVQGGAIVGGRVALAPFEVGAELFAGGRSIRLTHNINDSKAAADRSGVVEARLTAGMWATPWLLVEATAGSGIVDRNEWDASIGVAFHSRTFAGER